VQFHAELEGIAPARLDDQSARRRRRGALVHVEARATEPRGARPSSAARPGPPIASENPLFSSVNLGRAFSLSPPRSGDVPSPLATNVAASRKCQRV
jgi:hypothetical protein